MAVAGKRKGDEATQGEDKESKVLKNNLCTYFKRQSEGLYAKTTEEDKALAKKAQTQYQAMPDNEKIQFAKAFQANKHSKNFQWVKDFTDSLVAKKKTLDAGVEKYMTRSFAIKGYMYDALLSVGASPTKWMPLHSYGGSPHN
jgi:transcription termination factor NusB